MNIDVSERGRSTHAYHRRGRSVAPCRGKKPRIGRAMSRAYRRQGGRGRARVSQGAPREDSRPHGFPRPRAGEVTTAGSVALGNAGPARADAPAVARLRAAGFIPIGRTNMTEFAFSGLGINPHYGTPLSPHDRSSGRIPGGSSSGAAVSICDGMALGALGTDTGGSRRIPAGFWRLAGLKPTASRVPTQGAFPLSASLDSVGPLAATVACCAALDCVLAGDPVTELAP